MGKPGIIVTSADGDDEFTWLSDGWNSTDLGNRGTPRAEKLMKKACAIIEMADNVPDAIAKLERGGFKVTREGGL
jgi:hypothetical protein